MHSQKTQRQTPSAHYTVSQNVAANKITHESLGSVHKQLK